MCQPLFINKPYEYSKSSFQMHFAKEASLKKKLHKIRCVMDNPDPVMLENEELSKKATDICMVNLDHNADIGLLADKGLLMPLDDLLAGKEEMLDIALIKCTHRGRIFALMKNITLNFMFARRDILDRYGYDLPRTWDELKRQCGYICKDNKNLHGLLLPCRDTWSESFIDFYWLNGGVFLNENGDSVFSPPRAEETLEFFLELISQGIIPKTCLNMEPWRIKNEFYSGKSLFLYDRSDILPMLAARGKSRFDKTIKYHFPPTGPGGNEAFTNPRGSYFAVPANTSFPYEAVELVRFFSDWNKSHKLTNQFFFPFPGVRLSYRQMCSLPWYALQGYRHLTGARFPLSDIKHYLALKHAVSPAVAACMDRKISPAAAADKMQEALYGLGIKRIFPIPVAMGAGYIGEHFREQSAVSGAAAHTGLSKSYFSRIFRSAAGKSPKQYQIELRMDHVKKLLLDSRMKITDIAARISLEEKHFIKMFRKYTGKTPSAWRKGRR
ncbi:MAG TPA: hypothetical protein DC049_10215 [Spirochaetia bacterium]|nr:hypothetical protein [Spirochaetia bacterium]